MKETRNPFRTIVSIASNAVRNDAPPAASTALVPTVSNADSLAVLAAEIQRAHGETIGGLRTGAAAAIRAGKALNAAKKKMPHGFWEDYVALECRLSMRTAQTYMNLARREGELDQLLEAKAPATAFLTQAQALKFLGSSAVKKKRRKQKKTP